MKILKINRVLLCVVLLSPLLGFAQITNEGKLSVLPNTQISTDGDLDNKDLGDLVNDGELTVHSLYNNSGTSLVNNGELTVHSHYNNYGKLVNDGELIVYGDYKNDGSVSFTPGKTTGITRLQGSLSQNISGSVPMKWYNAEFNNSTAPSAFHLSNEVSVSGIANFLKGIVDNATYGGLVVFENTSSHTNTDDESHVNGRVRKNGNDAFTFPIGDKSKYRFAGISAPDNGADAFTGKYFFENADPLYPLANKSGVIEGINDKEYWTLDKTAGTSGIILTLSWDETTTTPANLVASPESAIHIVRWDAAQNLWVDEGGVVDRVNKTVTTPVNVLGYGVFTIARVNESFFDSSCSCVFYNAISPDGDGVNDYFRIDGLTGTQNTVEVYDRWGAKVYGTTDYDTSGNVFKGIAEGRGSIRKNSKLPIGTYFYVLTLTKEGKAGKKAGYLYIID